MDKPTELERLQSNFWKLVTFTDGVEKGLQSLQTTNPSIVPLQSWIRGKDEDFCIQRLDVYANMYFYRLFDILQRYFAKIEKVVGETSFYNLITEYLLTYPSDSPDIKYIGRNFPQFLQESDQRESYPPWLHELALLEWLRIDVVDMANHHVVTMDEMAAISPDAWETLSFEVLPAHHLIETQYPIDQVWEGLEKDQVPDNIAPDKREVLIWRENYRSQHAFFPPVVAEAFRRLKQGESFSKLCVFVAGDRELTEGANEVFTLLRQWVEDGILSNINIPGE